MGVKFIFKTVRRCVIFTTGIYVQLFILELAKGWEMYMVADVGNNYLKL